MNDVAHKLMTLTTLGSMSPDEGRARIAAKVLGSGLLHPDYVWLRFLIFRTTDLSDQRRDELLRDLGADPKLYRVQDISGRSPYSSLTGKHDYIPPPDVANKLGKSNPKAWAKRRRVEPFQDAFGGTKAFNGWYLTPSPEVILVLLGKVYEVQLLDPNDSSQNIQWLGVRQSVDLSRVDPVLPVVRMDSLEAVVPTFFARRVATREAWPEFWVQDIRDIFAPFAVFRRHKSPDLSIPGAKPPSGMKCQIMNTRREASATFGNNPGQQRRSMISVLLQWLLNGDDIESALHGCFIIAQAFASQQRSPEVSGDLTADLLLITLLAAAKRSGSTERLSKTHALRMQQLSRDIEFRWECWRRGLHVYGSTKDGIILYREP